MHFPKGKNRLKISKLNKNRDTCPNFKPYFRYNYDTPPLHPDVIFLSHKIVGGGDSKKYLENEKKFIASSEPLEEIQYVNLSIVDWLTIMMHTTFVLVILKPLRLLSILIYQFCAVLVTKFPMTMVALIIVQFLKFYL